MTNREPVEPTLYQLTSMPGVNFVLKSDYDKALEAHGKKVANEVRERTLEEAYQHCHGTVLDIKRKMKSLDPYDQGTLHGATRCENGIYFLLQKEEK